MSVDHPCLSLVPADEERELRSTVRAIAAKYGHQYWVSDSASGGNPTELGRDLGQAACWAWPCRRSTAAVGAPSPTW
jgi:hypothetical protein